MRTFKAIKNILEQNNNSLRFEQKDYPSGYEIKLTEDEELIIIKVLEFDHKYTTELLSLTYQEEEAKYESLKNKQEAPLEQVLEELNELVDEFNV